MSKFVKLPTKAIPMELDDSFTPVELIGKLVLKMNEIIFAYNSLNEKIDNLEIDKINEKIDNLKIYVDEQDTKILLEAKNYTDERIEEILNHQTISASDFDNLRITAQIYDNMNITAYRYDTESKQIFIIN